MYVRVHVAHERAYAVPTCTCLHGLGRSWGTQLSYRPVQGSAHFTSTLDVDKKLLPDMTTGAADALYRQAANLEAEVLKDIVI